MIRWAPSNIPESLKTVVDYRKSGLSLNHIVGCPLDCGYCVRHLFSNFEMKRPHRILSTEDAVSKLTGHWAFQRDLTPLQIFNRATDPFLPKVKEELFVVLDSLDALELQNPVLVITRWKVEPDDIARLEKLKHLRLTILVTWSGIPDKRIEPIDSTIAERSLYNLSKYASRTKSVLYWRPLIVGINDTVDLMEKALLLSSLADATAFTGLFLREEIQAYFDANGVSDLYPEIARRKILPEQIEKAVLAVFGERPIFRKTSCAVAFAHSMADYNGHFGIQDICDICPQGQYELCRKSHQRPAMHKVQKLAQKAGIDINTLTIEDYRIEVAGSIEQQRYYLQHSLNFQVHDRAHPHQHQQHGRASIGWEE